MLYREFDPAVIYASFSHKKYRSFLQWEEAARGGALELTDWVAAHPVKKKGDSLPVDTDLYRALKDCLCEYFHGKCAYCESEFDHVSWGDVEHYRPKRGVTGEVHPGYHWLAYTARNLMPSCQRCNQSSGKGNHFPIGGRRAISPADDLAAELPVLLSPYEQDDCKAERHIRFVIEESDRKVLPTGRVEGITDRGKESVERYGLNRPPLPRRRWKNQRSAIKVLDLAQVRRELPEAWEELFNAEQEHAAAVRAACLKWMELHTRQLQALPRP